MIAHRSHLTRRSFFKSAAAAAVAAGSGPGLLSLGDESEKSDRLRGKADACIFIWLGGGASQVDTFDPKIRGDGKKKAGSYYDAINTAVPGVQVCEHLRMTAPLLDRCAIVRSLSHEIVSEHGAATNLMHTGRKPSETIIYPSIGSVVSHQLGTKSGSVPAYVVMGYPNIARDPGFLGPKYGYVYLTQIETGPNGLMRPPDVDAARQKRREELLGSWQQEFAATHSGDKSIQAQADVSQQAFKLGGAHFLSTFDLSRESKTVRESYGGEFGQRCLLARRLVQAGVRFVEVSFNLNFLNGTGWDTHNE
jgi:hypothetical protein